MAFINFESKETELQANMDLPDQAIQEYEDRIQTAHHRRRFCFANRDKSQSCVCVSCRQPRQFKTKDHHFVLLPVYFESRALRNRLLQKVSDKTLSEEEFEAGGEPEGKIGTERDYKQSTPVQKLYQKRQVYRDPGVLRSIKVAGSSELHKKPVVYESPEVSKGSVTPMAPAVRCSVVDICRQAVFVTLYMFLSCGLCSRHKYYRGLD